MINVSISIGNSIRKSINAYIYICLLIFVLIWAGVLTDLAFATES